MNKRVLVTGADGFIGSHLTEELVRRGFQVRALVQYNSLNSWGWLDNSDARIKADLDVVAGDIRDGECVRRAVAGCDWVLHLAALIAIPYSYQAPHSYVDTNIVGTLNVLQAGRDSGVARIVHTSTSEVYGTAQFVPITESHPLHGQSPYSASKIGADQMAIAFHRSFATPVSVIRPFNTYGPRQSARAVLPTIITQMLSGICRIRLGALTPTRDFNYVKDVVRGFIAMAESERAIGEVINIGSNFEISVGDAARTIADIIGLPLEIETDEARFRPAGSEVDRLWACNAKAAELIGWTPAYGGLDGFRRGMAETIDWFRQADNLRRYKPETYNT
jgi:NAD dependent epimerase/dehydratase